MANDSVGVAAAGTPTNYIDNESISTGGSPATVDRQRVRIGGSGYADLADVVQGDTGQNMQIVAGARKEYAFSVTATTNPLVTVDCSNYRFVSVQVTTIGSGQVNFTGSNDGVNFFAVYLTRADITSSSTLSSNTNVVSCYRGAIPCRYLRLSNTGYSSGTVAGTVEFLAADGAPHILHTWFDGQNQNMAITQASSAADSFSNASSTLIPIAWMGYIGGSNWDRVRVPTTFKTVTATASGDTALWTPTSGKKFRLMRYKIEATADAASAGGAGIDVVLRDATTATAAAMSFYAPATSVTTNPGVISTGWVDLGNGVLSASANQVLNVNLSAALTSGKVRVVACGTEE